jgi:hypothetical protein
MKIFPVKGFLELVKKQAQLVYIRQLDNNKILDSSALIQKVPTEFCIFKNNLFKRLCLLQFEYELRRPFFKATNQAASEQNVSAFLAILTMQRFVISQQIDKVLKYYEHGRKEPMTKWQTKDQIYCS